MGESRNRIQFPLREYERERVEHEIEKQGVTMSEFGRSRFRAGWRLWDTVGGFDQKALDKMAKGEISEEIPKSEASEVSEISSIIRKNLSTEDPTPLHSGSQDDLIDVVIERLVKDALSDLMDAGEIRYEPGEGYLRV
jgi:hypothetical protein